LNTLAPTTARLVLIAALTLGGLADILFYQAGLGINLGLFGMVLAGYALTLARRQHPRPDGIPAAWIALAACCALTLALRDSELLALLNFAGLLAALALPFVPGLARRRFLPADIIWGGALAALNALGGTVRLVGAEQRWPSAARVRRYGPVAAGSLIALPIAGVFTLLFAQADPVFQRVAQTLLGADLDLGPAFSHAVLILAVAWLGAGYLRGQLISNPLRRPELPMPAGLPSGTALVTVATTVLMATTAVFSLFVVIQAGALFGGDFFVRTTAGVTYAEYARRGFFEMLAAAALALPMVWISAALRERAGSGALLRTLEWTQCGLVGLVLLSAFNRMLLYVGAYGLSEVRIYGTAAMVWLAAVLGWFALTVLRGARERFAIGAVVAGFAVLGALNVASPDALIVRFNAARAAAGLPFDAAYVRALSADAVPALVKVLPALSAADQCAAIASLARRRRDTGDWRSWNLGRSAARRALGEAGIARYSCEPAAETPAAASATAPASS
jgi:hypothetical protein